MAPKPTSKSSASGPPARRLGPSSTGNTIGSTLRSGYEVLTARENQSVVRAVGMFGVSGFL